MIRRYLFSAAILAASAAALGVAAPARAQDQSTPWQGWYVGANIGASWGDTSLHTTASAPPAPAQPIVIPPADISLINAGSSGSTKTGFVGGIEGGYNFRYGEFWLFGLETDYGALDVNKTNSQQFQSTAAVPVTYTLRQRATSGWLWTLRPRVGIVTGPWLFYGTAGVAVGDSKLTVELTDNRNTNDGLSMNNNSTKTGWTAGLGAGYAIGPQWSVKAEWLYVDLGSVHANAVSPNGYVAVDSEAEMRSNVVRVGVDYRF
jgi:outer membrane immunogenic protein